MTGHHLIQDDSKRIDIRALVWILPIHLFRRHVFRSADHHSCAGDSLGFEGAGDAEIHDPGIPLFIDHDILGFEVPMDNSQTVSLGQPLADLLGDVDRCSCGQLPGSPDKAF